MYFGADRIRAVELYIELGKRVKANIRQLGYPANNALKNWYRDYDWHRDLRFRCMARAPEFTEAKKQAALEHYPTHDRFIFNDESIELSSPWDVDGMGSRGVCWPTSYVWKNEVFGPEAASSMKRHDSPAPSRQREELERQLEARQRFSPIAARA